MPGRLEKKSGSGLPGWSKQFSFGPFMQVNLLDAAGQ
jgi:hypothetical protein